MPDRLEELVSSLLYEGYALYPYTPGATKNATPTPFGIVYPPVYAAGSEITFDRVRMECLARVEPGAALEGEARFLLSTGRRHVADEQRIVLPATSVEALARQPLTREFLCGPVRGRVRMKAERVTDGLARVAMCVHNATHVEEGLDRAEALRSSLLSTHVVVRITGGSFVSPLDPQASGCRNVNTWPVLATRGDDAVLGAAIALPDHPQLAPETRGNLFDNTEIEEALLLHVHALSDAERQQIQEQDPAIREMIARAAASTPEDLMALHGRLTLRDPAPGSAT